MPIQAIEVLQLSQVSHLALSVGKVYEFPNIYEYNDKKYIQIICLYDMKIKC